MTIFDPEAPPLDPGTIDALIAELEAIVAPSVPGFVNASMAPDLAFVAPWEGMLGDTAVDEATGITVPLDLEGAPVSPAFQDPTTGVWTVNPVYTAWAVQHMSGNLGAGIQYFPAPDPIAYYSGPNPTPMWADVYQWASDKARSEGTLTPGMPTVSSDAILQQIDAAIGSTVKALGGLISQSIQLTADLSRQVNAREDGLQLAVYVITSELTRRLDKMGKIQEAILKLAIPSLQAQILQEAARRKTEIDHRALQERQYEQDTIYQPLHNQILNSERRGIDRVNALHEQIPDIVRSLGPELIAPAIAGITALGTRVASLEDEAERCGRPMCATMGPQTPLGKFLKALSLLADAAIIADLLSLTEPELVQRLGDAIGKVAGLVADAEGFFSSTTETVGDVIAGLGAGPP